MSKSIIPEIRVSMDVGCHSHSVAIGLSGGELIEEFEIDRYRSCIINTDEYYLACVRYVYRNPLRANMVEDLEEFENSSFNFWAFGKKVDLVLADDHLVPLWDDGKDRLHRYFRILVLDEGIGIPSEKVARVGLRKKTRPAVIPERIT